SFIIRDAPALTTSTNRALLNSVRMVMLSAVGRASRAVQVFCARAALDGLFSDGSIEIHCSAY
ncbi:MAG: hypothetical protein ACI9KD_001316, partial [Congregibacter sp.]